VLALAGCNGGPARSPSRAPNSRASLPAPAITPGDLEARTLLGELPSRAARLGAGAPSLVVSAQSLDNEWLGGFVDVPRDVCVLVYARGATSIDDIDVAVYSDEGTTLAVDEGRDVHPTVLLCPPHPDRVYAAAHVVEGEGLAVVGAQLVPRERAVIVARALGARGAIAQGPRPPDAWPGLDDAVRAHRLALGGKWDEFKRVALPVDAQVPTYASMPIGADQCVDAVVVPDEDIALLDIEAVDEDGRVVARAHDGPGIRTLTVCSPVATAGTLSIRPHVGRGLAAVVLARAGGDVAQDLAARPDVAWIAPVQPLEAAKTARNRVLAKSGYAAPVTTIGGNLALGRRVSLPLDLQSLGGACGRVDVVAGAPLALVDAHVWGEGGALLASADGSSSTTLFVCSHGPARLELETRGRPGPFTVLVRPEPWRDGSFTAHPLAASRMLARAALGPDMVLAGRETTTREIVLDSGHVSTWTETVPAGRCVRVTVGAQGDGAGVDLRAFDGPDVELDRAEAAHAAMVRACAYPEAPRAIRFEARASAGRLDAVLGERAEAIEPPSP
jgi:hypothetical protein